MKTQIKIIVLFTVTFLSCGEDKSFSPEVTNPAQEKLSKPSSFRSPPKNWTAVGVTVSQNGQLLEGLEVKFSRSISGQPHDYQSEANATTVFTELIYGTDEHGWGRVTISTDPRRYIYQGASGYYSARVIDPETNVILGEWNSLPLMDGHRRTIFLEIGKPAKFRSEEAENEIREALFRDQMSKHPPQESFFALSLHGINGEANGIDPTDEFMARFQSNAIPVIKASQTEIRRPVYKVFHKETGETGVIFEVSGLRWINESEVVVDTGYYADESNAAIHSLKLELFEGEWVLKEVLDSLIIP